MRLLLLLLLLLPLAARASNRTVTHEARFELEGRGGSLGNFSVALFGKAVPLTVDNFVGFVRRFKGHGYSGTPVHKITAEALEMGDVTFGQDLGFSIYGPKFDDESFALSPGGPGWLGMAGHHNNSNRCRFRILRRAAQRNTVIFGKVTEGMPLLRDLATAEVFWETGIPMEPARVKSCEARELEEPKELPAGEPEDDF